MTGDAEPVAPSNAMDASESGPCTGDWRETIRILISDY